MAAILHKPGGGGGGTHHKKFVRYVPRQSEKWVRAPEWAPGRAWKCWAPERSSLSRFELENEGLWNELDPFWAWKCESPELPGRLWPAANPRRYRKLCVRAEPAVGGDERVEIKEILKFMVSGTAKNVEWWCSGTYFLVICENDMLRNRKSGLKMGVSRAAHTQYAYIWPCVLNSPPRKGGDVTLFRVSFHSFCDISAKQKGIVKYYGSFES